MLFMGGKWLKTTFCPVLSVNMRMKTDMTAGTFSLINKFVCLWFVNIRSGRANIEPGNMTADDVSEYWKKQTGKMNKDATINTSIVYRLLLLTVFIRIDIRKEIRSLVSRNEIIWAGCRQWLSNDGRTCVLPWSMINCHCVQNEWCKERVDAVCCVSLPVLMDFCAWKFGWQWT